MSSSHMFYIWFSKVSRTKARTVLLSERTRCCSNRKLSTQTRTLWMTYLSELFSSDLSLRVRKQKSVPVGRKKTCKSLFRQKSMSAPHWWIFYKDSFFYWNFQLNPSIFWQFLLIMSSSIQFCINFALKLMFLSKFFLKFCRLRLARFLAKVKLFVKYSPVLLHPRHILHCHLTTCTDGDWR